MCYASRIKAVVPGDQLSEITNQHVVFSGGKGRWASSAQVMLTAGDERGRDKLWHLHKKSDSSRRPARPCMAAQTAFASSSSQHTNELPSSRDKQPNSTVASLGANTSAVAVRKSRCRARPHIIPYLTVPFHATPRDHRTRSDTQATTNSRGVGSAFGSDWKPSDYARSDQVTRFVYRHEVIHERLPYIGIYVR